MGFLHAKAVVAYVSRAAFNGLYHLFGLFGRRDEVLFVSRKSSEPSYDYVECGKAFSAQGYEPVYLSQHFKKSSVLAYAGACFAGVVSSCSLQGVRDRPLRSCDQLVGFQM